MTPPTTTTPWSARWKLHDTVSSAGRRVTEDAVAGTHVHRRTMSFDAYDDGNTLYIESRLTDTRPWESDSDDDSVLHDMQLLVRIRRTDLVITDAQARMHRFPQTECPLIESAFGGLVGMSVHSGFARRVREQFAGPAGCSHLELLARVLAPAVFQAVGSARVRARAAGEDESEADAAAHPQNACHIWRDDGIGPRKVALGWKPGLGPRPAPPIEELR